MTTSQLTPLTRGAAVDEAYDTRDGGVIIETRCAIGLFGRTKHMVTIAMNPPCAVSPPKFSTGRSRACLAESDHFPLFQEKNT